MNFNKYQYYVMIFAVNAVNVSQFVLGIKAKNFILEIIIIFCPILILNTQSETILLIDLLILKVMVTLF